MPKRSRSDTETTHPSKRRVLRDNDAFGFHTTPCLDLLVKPCAIKSFTHRLDNVILRFENGQPIYNHPNKKIEIQTLPNSLYVSYKKTSERILKSSCHTPHTESLFKMAHELLRILHRRQRIRFVRHDTRHDFEVDMRHAHSSERGHAEDKVWLNAKYRGQTVILKTTTKIGSMLRYVIEAMIHQHMQRHCSSYVPTLFFVGFQSVNKGQRDRFVLCSSQLKRASVFSWVRSLRTLRVQSNVSVKLWKMLKRVCHCLMNLQQHVQFTHRDCHCNNVYYDDADNKPDHVKFIDFDWSSIMIGDHVVSVPRYLFDTTRASYAKNRSVDLCIFMRTLGPLLQTPERVKRSGRRSDLSEWMTFERKTNRFYKHIWKPLMQRYERESEIILKRNIAQTKVAMQLYKMNLGPDKTFGHAHGLLNLAKTNVKQVGEFDYRMGYFEWPCMTPTSVLAFLDSHKHYLYG